MFHINISDTVRDQATKISALKIEKSWHDYNSPKKVGSDILDTFLCDAGLKTPNNATNIWAIG